MNILFDDSGTFKTATILTDNETSLQVELSSGKRCKIKANNVLLRFTSPSSNQLLKQAEELAEQINSDINNDADFLWEVAPNGEFSFIDFAKEYFGNDNQISPIENTAILLVINALPMYFHRKGRGCFRKASEEILQAAKAAKLKKEQLAEQINLWRDELINGNIPPEILQNKNSLISYKRDRSLPYVKALELACSQLNISSAELLYKNKAFSSIYEIHYSKFIQDYFKEGTAFKQNDLLELEIPQNSDDVTNLPTADSDVQAFSIDDSSTTEIDDAFSVRFINDSETIVGIHIAAPALLIKHDSPCDGIAKVRISTVYIPGDKITMLPKNAVAACSLDEGKKVPTVSLYLKLNNQNFEILESFTKLENLLIADNLRTENLEKIFNDENLRNNTIPDDFKYKKEMLFLFDFADVCQKNREILKQELSGKTPKVVEEKIEKSEKSENAENAENAEKNSQNLVENISNNENSENAENLYAELQELNEADSDNENESKTENRQIDYSFDIIGDLSDPKNCKAVLKKRIRGAALDKIVSEMMILTNCIWGGILEDSGVPGIYRTQTFKNVRLSTRADFHIGLGVEQYAWCTSPLRRYCDLVNQWQLISCLNQQPQKAPFQRRSTELFIILKNFESTYSAYKDFQARMERYWCLRYIKQENISEAIAVIRKSQNVKVENLPLMLKVPSIPLDLCKKDNRIKIKLNLENINYFALHVDAEFVEMVD